MIQAVLFDFDGLILDTEGAAFRAWQEIYNEHGSSLPLSVWAQAIGTSDAFDPYSYLEGQLGRPVDREAVRVRYRQRTTELIEAQAILPGVVQYIATAGRLGLKLGVASSSSREWVTGHLARLGLADAFVAVKCSDDVRLTKPDPQVYHLLLAALGSLAHQAVALEDSPNGVMAAQRAGVFCVAVPNPLTRQLPLDQADLRLASLADMPLEQLLLSVPGNRQ
ncbi:MAG: HAD family hydrolase [Dehalococcoidia bacterium]|nr:HAD family hydrolase [Dehalococcoidia bacterium]